MKQKLWIFILLCCSYSILSAQNGKISGMVTDANGESLAGVSVVVKGTALGTSTDGNGNYILSGTESNSVLIFSYLGYTTLEITVGSNNLINVKLEEQNQALNEVVVVGYGSMEKSKITSAITNVKPEEFNRGNINNPAQLLQGKVAGLSIAGSQGNPNGEFTMRLRGLSTIGANTQPLVIIDGFIGADIRSVDPNDIASIDVLKDGGAAAIYGTRGSSGVIIITTKTGAADRFQANYNGYIAVENMDRVLPVMSHDEYLAQGGSDYGSNTNWMDEITRPAFSNVHNLSLSGGNKKTTYSASLNYRNVQGIVNKTGFDQISGRLNLSQKTLGDRLTIGLNLSMQSGNANLGFDDVFRSAIVMPPTAPVYGQGSNYDQYGGYWQNRAHELFNPVAIINQNTNDQKSNNLIYNISGELKIIEGLTASVRYAQNNENYLNGTYISRQSLYGSGMDRNGLATRSTQNNQSQLFEATGNYLKSFDRLNLNLLGGYSYQNFISENYSVQAGNFLTDAFSYNNLAAASDFADGKASASSFKESNTLISFFGRVNLSYDNTYFLMASLRREGSSRFGDGNKWGNFTGLSAGADIAKMTSIKNVDQLKLRISYGVTGALPAQSYLSKQIYGPGSSLVYYWYDGMFTPVYSPQSNPNPDLKWETKAETNIGVDFSLFNTRLTGSFDFYNRNTSDALITLNVPVPPNLYPTTVLNAGKLRNRGFEVALNGTCIKTPDFSWNSQLTFASNRAKIISLSMGDIKYGVREVGGLPAPLTGNVVRVEEGKPIGQIIGWKYEGVDADGNYIIKDLDNNGVINENDIAVIGNGLPKCELGFGNKFEYKGFDFSFFFRGVFGHDLINIHRTLFEQVSRVALYNLIDTKYFDPAYKGNVAYNSRYVENASFVKLDNLSLGYTFRLPAHSVISSLRTYVTGQNLFYITGYSGVDPEPRYSYQGNVLAPGVEPLTSWVTTRTFTLGVNITF